jgi:DNA-binding MurR/RpiR family transcriptional regulator
MGKAYAKELALLPETYRWALGRDLHSLTDFITEAHGRPLIAVGSGGSSTAAHLAALLHRYRCRGFARHATPLELMLSEPGLHGAALLLLSASGKNRDVLDALDHGLRFDARTIATICTQSGSPLAARARAFGRAHVFDDDIPGGKDGFLATNSLFATCVLLARAYSVDLPPDIDIAAKLNLLHNDEGRATVVVLHGGWSSPVATDLESKLNESAIAGALVSDYRNFGHGRHLWLARRREETLIVLLATPETKTIAERTRALLPKDFPVAELSTTHEGAAGTLALLVQAFHLVGELGQKQGYDPGRPSVPEFGRKLYHLASPRPANGPSAPVARKLAASPLCSDESATEFSADLDRFIEELRAMKISGLVLDYDGTLCSRSERFGALRADLSKECARLLAGGLWLGIATGRGQSVRKSLQESLPNNLWAHVLIGYYNGGEIGPLTDNAAPARDELAEPPLDVARRLLEADSNISRFAALTVRRRQITVEPKHNIATSSLTSIVMTTIAAVEHLGVRVLASSHSVDVLAPGVSKLKVIDAVGEKIAAGTRLLCIGDRGEWPGNDFAMLSHGPSLSVDEVSASPGSCWNLAPFGESGPDATLRYLRAVVLNRGSASFDARNLWRVP